MVIVLFYYHYYYLSLFLFILFFFVLSTPLMIRINIFKSLKLKCQYILVKNRGLMNIIHTIRLALELYISANFHPL